MTPSGRERVRAGGLAFIWLVQAGILLRAIVDPSATPLRWVVAHLAVAVVLTVALLSPAGDRWVREGHLED